MEINLNITICQAFSKGPQKKTAFVKKVLTKVFGVRPPKAPLRTHKCSTDQSIWYAVPPVPPGDASGKDEDKNEGHEGRERREGVKVSLAHRSLFWFLTSCMWSEAIDRA